MKDLPIAEYFNALTKTSHSVPSANGVYDFGLRPWMNNVNDRVAYDREFASGCPDRMRMAQALISQSPLTPDKEIRQNMTVRGVPSRFGYSFTELTVTQVLDGDFDNTAPVKMFHANDFSGTAGETNSTSRPSIW